MTIDAIYAGGVFKSLESVGVAENQRVRLAVEPAGPAGDWFAEAAALRQRLFEKYGLFSDSTSAGPA